MVLSLSTASWSPLNQKQIMSPTLYKTETWNLYPGITVIQAVKAKVVITWMLSRREFEPLSWLQGIHTCLTEVREKVIKGVKGKQQRATITLSAGLCCLVTGTKVTLRFFPLIPVSYDVDLQLPSMSFTMSGGTALVEMSYMQVTAKVKHILCFLFGILCTRTYFICIRYSGCWDEFLGSEESGGPGAGLLYHFEQLLFFLGWA